MCGIIGIFESNNSRKQCTQGLSLIEYRGRDEKRVVSKDDYSIGHRLHSIVGAKVVQPFKKKNSIFACNSEIYNWKTIDERYGFNSKNDSYALFNLLELKGLNALSEIDGDYAFAYIENDTLYLARDTLGIKPLWYSEKPFAFCSEKKVLTSLGYLNVIELNPRQILKYNIKTKKVEFIKRDFFAISPEHTENLETIKYRTKYLLEKAILKRVPGKKLGLLFSGGVDSTTIALVLKQNNIDFTCYTAVLDEKGLKEPEDLIYAKKIAKELKLKLEVIKIKLKDIEKHLKVIVPLIEDYNVTKVSVALTFFVACKKAKEDKCKVLFSGLGSEEIFAGYKRHKESNNVNKECVSGLLNMHERDLYRDDVITMFNNLELRVPFLDNKLIDYALKIPEKYKLSNDTEKYILRLIAKDMGLKEKYAMRKKRAAQYGSNFLKSIEKLTKRAGFKLKSDYLRQFTVSENMKLGALISGGKDSIYALYKMQKQGYPIKCLITIKSKNPDSYMFHTPTIDLVELQSIALNIPLLTIETEGIENKELSDLKKVLLEAKRDFKIEGVITGALYSTYQRDRIKKVADSIGLTVFSPLWHTDQETLVKEVLSSGFKFIVTKVAAEGLSKDWLNREINVEELKKIKGINIAGEGGEYETLVLDCPLFSKKLELTDYKTIMENNCTGFLVVKNAKLKEK